MDSRGQRRFHRFEALLDFICWEVKLAEYVKEK